ncbi:MAG: Cys-tRNA(Pro) deacylase [bacterium]
MSAQATPATTALDRLGIPYSLHPYRHDPRGDGYGAEAARALEVDEAQLFKTLIASVDAQLVCAVVPVSRQLDLKALARAVSGRRAVMAEPSAAQRATGYVLGGISPLGQRTRLPVVLDDSATGFDAVYVSAGQRGLQLRLAPEDLKRASAAVLAPLAR